MFISFSVAWMIDPFPSLSETFSNEHDVIDTVQPLSIRTIGEARVSAVDGVTLTEVRVSVPLEIEKRE